VFKAWLAKSENYTPHAEHILPKEKLKVLCDMQMLIEPDMHLKEIQFVGKERDADVVFQYCGDTNFIDWLPRKVYLNFPNSMAINVKNAMAETMSKKYGAGVSWLPETYDMDTQLPWFVARYKQNAAEGKDNHWIVKPCNSACVRGIFVTTHLPTIVRCGGLGLHLVQKYIERPILVHQKKFDLRIFVMLRSTSPFRAFIHRDGSHVRWTGFPFTLDEENQGTYLVHFTGNKLPPGSDPKTKFLCNQHGLKEGGAFWKNFEKAHGPGSHDKAWNSIVQTVGQFFEAAAEVLGAWPNARQLLGCDVMFDEDMRPYILECNESPEFQMGHSVCEQYYEDMFDALFLDRTAGNPRLYPLHKE
jgi:hypothetical protein